MAEVTGVDKARRRVFVNSADRDHVSVPYDYLILATGVRHSYFGHDEFEKFAPGLKSLAEKSVDELIDLALSHRPDLVIALANLRARQAVDPAWSGEDTGAYCFPASLQPRNRISV